MKCYMCMSTIHDEIEGMLLSPPYTEAETTMYVGKIDYYPLCRTCFAFVKESFIDNIRIKYHRRDT